MGKQKADRPKKAPHPHLQARLAFLHKAAQLLETQQVSTDGPELENDAQRTGNPQVVAAGEGERSSDVFPSHSNPVARYLMSHTMAISRKTKLRVPQDEKRTVCKRCSAKLVDGRTSTSRIENMSRGGRKPWADVLVVTCLTCRANKRFPIGQQRGVKKEARRLVLTPGRIPERSADG
ncbi:uncharacterized protein PV09_00406 [Verruconis gallopava]|uniref:Uncharacterized protein n=1 Tax=Verruconis gallopava TaxID=253628 RepID=A0A0D1Z997_9PEZI|nr:uncharacterized protein PV09_00406 [Verruconis gallopava]KIW09532.1 hypothetical protein PV09_00406 [Verruconis gallopava]